MAYHILITLGSAPLVDIMNGLAQVYAFFKPAKGFYVIRK